MVIVQDVVDHLCSMIRNSERFQKRRELSGDFFLISAVLDKKGRIISLGENNGLKTHPKMMYYSSKTIYKKKKIYLHAEISALIRSPYKKAHTIVVIRLNRNGHLAMARPCPVCQLAIADSGVKNVYYSNNEGGISYTGVEFNT